MRLHWTKRSPKPPRSRRTKTLAKRIDAVMSSADTYVYGGILAIGVGTAVVVGTIFGLAIGAGSGVGVSGLCIFGVGMWLLPPRIKGAE